MDENKIEKEFDFLNYAQDMARIALWDYSEFKALSEEEKAKIERIITKAFYLHGMSLEENPKAYFENLNTLHTI